MKSRWLFLFLILAGSRVHGETLEKISLPLSANITRADLWIANTAAHPVAVLVLCPGMNGSAEPMLREAAWLDFAIQNHLGLIGLSFASTSEDLYAQRGYTFPEQGSGQLLLSAIRQKYGSDLPILLCGFSSGAYFTERFVALYPAHILAWSAQSTGRYEEHPALWPPGLVTCGQSDFERYGAALTHFKKGRAAGGKHLWIGLADCGHDVPARLQDFIRSYFAAILRAPATGLWVDIDTEKTLSQAKARDQPALSGWLPDADLLPAWKALNSP